MIDAPDTLALVAQLNAAPTQTIDGAMTSNKGQAREHTEAEVSDTTENNTIT